MSLSTMCWTLLLISRLTTPLVLQLTHLLIKKLKKDWCLMLLICSTLEHAIGGRYLKKTKREWGTDFCRNKDPRKLSMSIPFSTSPSTPIITGIVVALFPTFVQSWFLGLIIYYYRYRCRYRYCRCPCSCISLYALQVCGTRYSFQIYSFDMILTSHLVNLLLSTTTNELYC